MKVANILPNNCIKEGMLRQDVEMFLTHKILEDPRRFAFLSNEKGAHYKILDNSACELGEGLDLRDVLEAAKIIDADEIVLPDIPRSGKSMCKTLKYLADVPQGCKYKLAAVVQGETEQEIANCAMQILSLKRINTIMIPKWYCGWNSTNGMGRIRITSQIVDMMCKMRKAKEIHWLGLDTGFRELIHPINAVVRSVDTGYFAALTTEKWKDYDIFADRPRELKIDLQHMDVDMEKLQLIIGVQKQFLEGEMDV